MKFNLQLTLLSIIIILFCCNNSITAQNINDKKKQVNLSKDLNAKKNIYKYVTASSGLNYRDKPNGKLLGKFNWRDKVKYLFDTEYKQKIIDNYSEIEDIWVAIEHKKDTVFVFNYYLSNYEPSISRIKLYYAEAYYSSILKPSNKKDIRHAFVNVSQSFYMPKNFIDKKDLQKDTIHFNPKKRAEFFKRMNYSNKDTLFIYDIATGLVKKHPIKTTPLMGCISIYSQINDEYKTENYYEEDYEIGFNLGKASYSGFAIIGKENPFVEKGLQRLIFEEMDQETINNNIKNKLIPENWKNDTINKPYMFNYKNMRSFVKKGNAFNNWSNLLIKNVQTKEAYHIYQSEGESSSKAPLNIKGEKSLDNYSIQYIGKLLKNKPPVAFGFMWESFGCPLIHFLDKEELPILILCDNRH